MVSSRVVAVTKKFEGHLEDWRLEDIVNCVEHGETWLDFETLCDYIAEFDISISTEEYNEIMNLVVDVELNLDRDCMKCLKNLLGKFKYAISDMEGFGVTAHDGGTLFSAQFFAQNRRRVHGRVDAPGSVHPCLAGRNPVVQTRA